ncbi:uncharacterized protein C4orf36 homolog [Marmota marmota marmota]|nr:uncharacterized protein C4orf36 homolog [Marmota marmota marmota]XP_048640817.1 uncharacterized protein C4orf36 homolog [Marmota marmota marmota]
MAYGLPRKNTVKTILQCSCYKVQEPWDLAVLTRTWYQNLADLRLPFLEEITLGCPIQLKKCKTKKGLLPSAEALKLEREYEMKRLTALKCQENVSKEVGFSLKEKTFDLRRPLPPKWQSSHNRVFTLFPEPKGDEELSLCKDANA